MLRCAESCYSWMVGVVVMQIFTEDSWLDNYCSNLFFQFCQQGIFLVLAKERMIVVVGLVGSSQMQTRLRKLIAITNAFAVLRKRLSTILYRLFAGDEKNGEDNMI